MTAAPNFPYALLAKRLRKHAEPGQFDLSSVQFALSGVEQVVPEAVEHRIDAGHSRESFAVAVESADFRDDA